MFFSVIVPIYKVEKYLDRCITSVLNQSFRDFELILVDDGSPDKCPEICDYYAKKDERIRVVHKKNGGLVSARQAGIKLAKGEYVYNLDGDDALFPDTLKNAYETAKNTSADMISFSYTCYKNGEPCEKIDEILPEGLYTGEKIKNEVLPNVLLNEKMRHLIYFLCGKAIKRSLVTEPQLQVSTTVTAGEDVCCAAVCYMRAKSVYISRKSAFLYTQRDDSLSKNFNERQFSEIEEVVRFLHSRPCAPRDFDSQIARYSCFMCFALLAQAAEGGSCRKLNKIKKLITKSAHMKEIKKAKFKDITVKSRIAVRLMKMKLIYTAFCFLNVCGKIKGMKSL